MEERWGLVAVVWKCVTECFVQRASYASAPQAPCHSKVTGGWIFWVLKQFWELAWSGALEQKAALAVGDPVVDYAIETVLEAGKPEAGKLETGKLETEKLETGKLVS